MDVGIKHDQASVVAVTYDEEGRRVVLARHRTFQPTPEDPLDLEETVERFLLELHQGYTLRSVYYDPYQFHRSATTLTKQGLPMEEFPQTNSNLTAMGQNLYELVQFGNLQLYPDEAMKKAAGQAVALETARGFPLTLMTVEELYGTLSAYLDSEPFAVPPEFYNEAQLFLRQKGRLTADLLPAHLRVTALAAAVQGCLPYPHLRQALDRKRHRR